MRSMSYDNCLSFINLINRFNRLLLFIFAKYLQNGKRMYALKMYGKAINLEKLRYDTTKLDEKSLYKFEKQIGKGSFGKVWKVSCKKTHKQYAIKMMKKTDIVFKKMTEYVLK